MFNLIEWLYLRQKNNLVYFDPMTKLHNRHYYDRVVKVKYNGMECVVLYVDINGLKKINDTEGHAEGTEFIAYIGAVLQDTNADDVCRIGGDEFVLIYTKDRFIEENFDWLEVEKNGEVGQRALSYGSYEKEPYEDMSSAVRKADERMYEMKKKFHESENTLQNWKEHTK